jgi:alpha-N-arabinofuranosidase
MTEPEGPAWRQTIFHPFAHTARTAAGAVLHTELETSTYETERHGRAPVSDAVLTHDPEHGTATLYAVNRSTEQPLTLAADLRALVPSSVTEARVLAETDPYAVNTMAEPDKVTLREAKDTTLEEGRLTTVLPPISWTAITFTTGV